MNNDLVRYSRAGDEFHYRWAARRCLKLVHPNSKLEKIIVEGSKEPEMAGEYVIDVAEYSHNKEDGIEAISYYQLKHTTVRCDDPFTLSDLKRTFEGFSERYKEYREGFGVKFDEMNFSFIVLTNRPIAADFKGNILALSLSQEVGKTFVNTIKKYTGLDGEDLAHFCSLIHLSDSEGDYNIQRDELQTEISEMITGNADSSLIEHLIALVRKKVLPDSDGVIVREEILNFFGISSERDLFPAPVVFEELDNIIMRPQFEFLKSWIGYT